MIKNEVQMGLKV